MSTATPPCQKTFLTLSIAVIVTFSIRHTLLLCRKELNKKGRPEQGKRIGLCGSIGWRDRPSKTIALLLWPAFRLLVYQLTVKKFKCS